jgi:2-polyprenyl-3-methyl-5-hydroxy-6-metoxy-1,4-benzoquinol methylase
LRGYETDRPDIQRHVPRDARSILELGCSGGALGAALKARQDVTVVGVEPCAEYASDAAARLDRVVAVDAESFLRAPRPSEAPFDCLIAADVLEHLVDPWSVLARTVDLLSPGATVVVSLPNVVYWRGLVRLVRTGRWPLDEEGVFDRTHLRWFTRDDALELLRQAGLRVVDIEPRYWVSGWALRWRRAVAKTSLHRFLPPQYVITALKEPADDVGTIEAGAAPTSAPPIA